MKKYIPFVVWILLTVILTLLWIYQDEPINMDIYSMAIMSVILGLFLSPVISVSYDKPINKKGWIKLFAGTILIGIAMGLMVLSTIMVHFNIL